MQFSFDMSPSGTHFTMRWKASLNPHEQTEVA